MKTITQIKQHFSDNEIKICVDIINGKLDFSVLDDQIKDFYSDEYNEEDLTGKDDEMEWLKNDLLEKLEFDFDFWGLI